jgi:type I restriction enzyme, S subunit
MNSEDWPEVRLGDHVDSLTGFPFKSAQFTDDLQDVRLVRGDNVVQGRFRWDGVRRWPRNEIDTLSDYLLEPGDVILAMDRPWIEAGLKYAAVSPEDLPCLLVQRVSRLRGINGMSTRFLRYVIGSPAFTEYVLAVQTGTAVPHISGRQIADFRFPLPPVGEQECIADTLGALDAKIELNRRMNHALESIACAIFNSWFVDFDPVRKKMEGREVGLPLDLAALFPSTMQTSSLRSIPEGWRVVPIGEAIDVVGGSTPSTSQPEFWDGDISFATPKDLAGLHGAFLRQTARRITERGARSISSGVLSPGTVLLSSRAPVGYVAISMIPVTVNQGFIAMPAGGELPGSYVYFWLRANMDAIVARANGTTFLEVSKRSFRPLPVLVPPASVLNAYDILVQPVLQRVALALEEAEQLAELRDQLLPRLIGGDGHG